MSHIKGIQAALTCHHLEFLVNLEKELVNEYNEILKYEKMIWFEK